MQEYSKREPFALGFKGKYILVQTISRISRFIVLGVLCIAISILNPSFLNLNNMFNILRQMTPILVLALGQMIVILTRGIDLSMGAVGALAGVIVATMLEGGQSILLSIIVGLAIGALFGLINGLVVTKIGLPPFVTTFGTLLVGRGIVVFYIHGRVVWGFPETFRFLGTGEVFGVPFIFLIGIFIIFIFYMLLNRTNFGARAYSIGSNPIASEISGIKIKKILTITYVISGIMAAFASILYISRLNSAKSDIGEGFEMDAIAGALIGGTSFAGGIGTVGGTVVGALIIIILRNAMNLLGISQILHGFATGTMMILMILGDEILRRKIGNH